MLLLLTTADGGHQEIVGSGVCLSSLTQSFTFCGAGEEGVVGDGRL